MLLVCIGKEVTFMLREYEHTFSSRLTRLTVKKWVSTVLPRYITLFTFGGN